jgi:Zn-dependent protease
MNPALFPVNCLFFLAAVDFHSPALWAVVLAWIMSVCVHEFAHGIVAYMGGDHTIRERGGLTLNPLQYIDPVFSVLLPIFFLLSGGIPLPGGVTHIRTDLLRSKGWCTAVALAGPASNLLLFFLFALPFHPRINWLHQSMFADEWNSLQLFLGTMVFLQFLAVIVNVIPIPPLDGFNAIQPYFDSETQAKFNHPQVGYIGLAVLYFVIFRSQSVVQGIYDLQVRMLLHLGFNDSTLEALRQAFNKVMRGG